MEVQWDRGGHSHQKWDGSRKSETVEQLIGQMETSGEHVHVHVISTNLLSRGWDLLMIY